MNAIERTKEFVRLELEGDGSGHDWWHIEQVYYNALSIAKEESKKHEISLEIVELASLLHDIADSKKYNGDNSVGPKVAREWLERINVDDKIIQSVCTIIEKQSFFAQSGKLTTIEGQIVQDADRLEAIGAIGIARCFAYGGSKGRPIYNPSDPDKQHSIQHFYDKLLKLKDLFNTETGKKLANDRHEYMKQFLEQFYGEIKKD